MATWLTTWWLIKIKTRALRERNLCKAQNVIWDSNPDFCITPNLNLDVCEISPKISWIHSHVGLRSAKYRENQPVIV